MEMKKSRHSNIELLRICAMLMIIMDHIVIHCINVQLTDTSSIERMGNGLFNEPVFFKKLMVIAFIIPWGNIGNALFMLISGYFMAGKQKIDITKISKKILAQLGMAAILLVLISTVCYLEIPDIKFNLVKIWDYNDMSWFAGYYFLIILGAKIFLNKFLNGLEEKQYISFLISCFAIIQLSWSRILADNLASGLTVLITGFFLYSFGGYIKKYNPFGHVKTWAFIGLIIIVYIMIYISNYNNTVNMIQDYIFNGSNGEFYQNLNTYGNNSIVVIIIGICLFEIFKRLRIPQNRFINYVGAATFMTYLIHDNGFSYSIWNTQDWITLLYYNPLLGLGKIFAWALLFLGGGIIAYSIYIQCGKLFNKYQYVFLTEDSK